MHELHQLAQTLRHRLSLPLPGREAQLQMAHAERRINLARTRMPDDARWGAVLILFYEEDYKIKIPLILRESGGGIHAGQISFPGGKFENTDADLSQTALREAEEEINVARDRVELLGKLTDLYIPPSNFLVHPFVGFTQTVPDFLAQPEEVAEVIPLTLDELLNDALIAEREIKLSNGLNITTPCFNLDGHPVWGATAMMLNELKTVCREIMT